MDVYERDLMDHGDKDIYKNKITNYYARNYGYIY